MKSDSQGRPRILRRTRLPHFILSAMLAAGLGSSGLLCAAGMSRSVPVKIIGMNAGLAGGGLNNAVTHLSVGRLVQQPALYVPGLAGLARPVAALTGRGYVQVMPLGRGTGRDAKVMAALKDVANEASGMGYPGTSDLSLKGAASGGFDGGFGGEGDDPAEDGPSEDWIPAAVSYMKANLFAGQAIDFHEESALWEAVNAEAGQPLTTGEFTELLNLLAKKNLVAVLHNGTRIYADLAGNAQANEGLKELNHGGYALALHHFSAALKKDPPTGVSDLRKNAALGLLKELLEKYLAQPGAQNRQPDLEVERSVAREIAGWLNQPDVYYATGHELKPPLDAADYAWLKEFVAENLKPTSKQANDPRAQAVINQIQQFVAADIPSQKKPAPAFRARPSDPNDPSGERAEEAAEFAEKIERAGMPEKVKERALKELKKFSNPQDREADKIRGFLEWLTDLPWSKRSKDSYDLANAQAVLDVSHFGLKRIKERIVESLVVRKKTGGKKGAILCFVGPPGTGKTSIASAIAKAMNREFVQLALGGVNDVSDLRGHGYTYSSSEPGLILQKMKEAGTVNPVFLLDEVDKLKDGGNHGDPASALMEILDPKQNNKYLDHYLRIQYDLSQVFFIVTANDINGIPKPLRDRMEIIEFEGYATDEKLEIAKRHVVPEKRADNGLKPGETRLTDAAILRLIREYTPLQAGMRKVQEAIDMLMRKISTWTETKSEAPPQVVDAKDIPKYLGEPPYVARQAAPNAVGRVTGLGVNDGGGSTLNVIVSVFEEGSGRLRLRKQMLEMIDDSAQNVYDYVRSNAGKFGISPKRFNEIDISISVSPAGKVDGPSAGITMVTAVVSSLTGRKVKDGIAMTGEITADGRVLPIGGLKQKVLAAYEQGYRTVIFPKENHRDAEAIPENIRKEMKLVEVESAEEVLALALEEK